MLVAKALQGGPDDVRRLVDLLRPSVQAEVATVVLRRGAADPRTVRVEVEDIVQDVWETLFRDDWRILRQYRPDRGASLRTFVALISRRVAIDILRSGRRNPWREQPSSVRGSEMDRLSVSLEERIHDRNLLEHVYRRIESELGDKGRSALESMFKKGLTVDEATRDTGMTKSALYSWKKRIVQRARAAMGQLAGPGDDR